MGRLTQGVSANRDPFREAGDQLRGRVQVGQDPKTPQTCVFQTEPIPNDDTLALFA